MSDRLLSTALVFPGQGSQHAGMGEWLSGDKPAAGVFDEAERLGFPAREICLRTPDAELGKTDVTQPALLTVSDATLALLRARGLGYGAVAGHSLGEYSALVAAGVLPCEAALHLVRRRGELMARSHDSDGAGMVAVIGLDATEMDAICAKIRSGGHTVVVANYNCPGQTVVSSAREGLTRVVEMAQDAGARRVIPLAVSGAFHSPLMREAQRDLAEVIQQQEFRAPDVRFYSNVTAISESDPERIRALAIDQVTSSVRWEATVAQMWTDGTRRFIEVGPGNVLAGLIRRTRRDAEVLTTHSIEAIDEVSDVLARQ